jgi:hypothetical protein
VVHKGRKEEDIWSSLKYKQKKRSIQFDLEQYRGSLFADIFTNDIDFFHSHSSALLIRRFFVLIGVLFFQSFLFNKRGFGLFF